MAWFRVALLLGVVGTVVLVAVLGIAAPSLERRAFPRLGRAVRRAAVAARALVGAGLLLLAYSLFIEADWLEVTHVEVTSPKLPTGVQYRIALVSDLHVEYETRALMALRRELKAHPADLVVFAGDAVNRRDALTLFHSTLVDLGGRLGRAAVRGNHDVVRWADVDLFGGFATELLTDRPLLLDDDHLALCGAPVGGAEVLETCLAQAPQTAFTILAYHTPDLIEGLEHRPDLYLAGHTHGGQVRLPGYGALITFSAHDKAYESGRFDVRGTTLVVTRGVGFEPGFPRLRFLARPEVVEIDVIGTGPATAEEPTE